MNISYNAWASYKECPKKHFLQYIKRARPTEPINDYHTLYGKLVGRYFEMYSNIWRFTTPYLFPDIIKERCEKMFNGILITSMVDWSAPGCSMGADQILEQACKDIYAVMDSPNLNLFLGTQAELAIEIKLNNGNSINGRMDFLHTNLDKSIQIFDGKGSKNKGKYIDVNQLYFYALLYLLHFKVMPVDLGFFYYRHNSYDPVPFNIEILNDFRARLSLDIKAIIEGKNQEPTPSAKACKFCKYLTGCPEGSKAKAGRAKASKLDIDGDGLVQFGF
jgi:CRISPR/Cas system-associated exonuclease Cas4 (RecB family)